LRRDPDQLKGNPVAGGELQPFAPCGGAYFDPEKTYADCHVSGRTALTALLAPPRHLD